MALNTDLLESISQTSYLTAEKYKQYRAIMRIFYQEYQRMRYQLDKETLFSQISKHPEISNYTIEQLKLDLNQLVEWKNLTPIQDPRKVYTVAEYKNKQFQYSMSEVAVEVERMTVAVEDLLLKTSSLSSNLFLRIYHALREAESVPGYSLKETNEWWQNLQEDFKRLNQSYQDYYRDFYSPAAEKIMRTMEFIAYKKQLIDYLEAFVRELQASASRTETVLGALDSGNICPILEHVIRSELSIPRPQSAQTEHLEKKIKEQVWGKWRALTHWFLDENSIANQVLEVTNEVIRHVVQNAALIVQMHRAGISKKAEYGKFLSLFSQCGTIQDAHRLSAQVFGIQQVRHFIVNNPRSTDEISESVYDEIPMTFPIRPRIRAYKPKIDKSGFLDKSVEKAAARKLILEDQRRLRSEVLRHIQNGKLDFANIDAPVSPEVRSVYLSWIASANVDSKKRGITEYGQKFTLSRGGKNECTLLCTDGELIMPDYILLFEEDENA